jgi:hypothetical protein
MISGKLLSWREVLLNFRRRDDLAMTKDYVKPMAEAVLSTSEDVYMASGDVAIGGGTTGSAQGKCDSKYMNGVYQAPNYYTDASYGERFGCNGCPAFRYGGVEGCGIQLETYWGSYDVDNGNRKPSWESKGHSYDEPINWNSYDM